MSKQLELIGVESLQALQLNGVAIIKGEKGDPGSALSVTNTATVGQTIKITAVDEDGQPTGFEATDMPSGGSITSSDDGNGNVTLVLSGGISVSDDGAGNVTIA